MNSVKISENQEGPEEDDEWLEVEKYEEPKIEVEQKDKDSFQEFSVNEIIDENFEPKTFSVKPY